MSSFYRFRTGSSFDIDCLLQNKIWIANPKSFNDPYDCAIQFDLEGRTLYTAKESLAKIMNVNVSQINPEAAKFLIKKIKVDMGEDRWKQQEQVEAFFQAILSKYIDLKGIACFFPSVLSIAMWSYYANYHKGFCIEYSDNDLKSIGELKSVDYLDGIDCIYAQLNAFQDDNYAYTKEIINKLILTKSIEWKHENEVRLIYSLMSPFKDKQPGIKIDSPPIKAIYLGCKSFENDNGINELIIKYGRTHNIPVFQMKKLLGTFKLECEQLF